MEQVHTPSVDELKGLIKEFCKTHGYDYKSDLDSMCLVEEFHKAFGHPVNSTINIDNPELNALRYSLISEELDELHDALIFQDAKETLDALCDLQYVIDGTWLALGFHKIKARAIAEVHKSNMSKLNIYGEPIYREDGKILKSIHYVEPNFDLLLNEILPQAAEKTMLEKFETWLQEFVSSVINFYK